MQTDIDNSEDLLTNQNLDPDSYIVGGEDVTPGQYPSACEYQYTDGYDWWLLCTAVIYNQYTVLTAAHCVEAL